MRFAPQLFIFFIIKVQYSRDSRAGGGKPAADVDLRVSFAAIVARAWRVGGFFRPFENRQLGVAATDDDPMLRIFALFAADFTSIVGADHGGDLSKAGNKGPRERGTK